MVAREGGSPGTVPRGSRFHQVCGCAEKGMDNRRVIGGFPGPQGGQSLQLAAPSTTGRCVGRMD